jgi:hypothetical protein
MVADATFFISLSDRRASKSGPTEIRSHTVCRRST